MADDRRHLLARREILAGYLKVLDQPARLLEVCSSVQGDAEDLSRAVQEAFAVSEMVAQAILALQVRRLTPHERDKIQAALADVDLLLEQGGEL